MTVERVALLLVTYRSAGHVPVLAESLRGQGVAWRAYVVDNASPDGSAEVAESALRPAWLDRRPRNEGFAAAANRAASRAVADGAEWLLFCNPDVRFDPAALDALAAAADERSLVVPQVLLPGGGLEAAAGPFDFASVAWRGDWIGRAPTGEWLRPHAVAMASLCCLLVPASAWVAAGPLDETLFMYYEDFDFVARCRRAGFAVRYEPAARVWHAKGASSGGAGSPFVRYYAARNRYLIARRWSRGPLRLALFTARYAAVRAARGLQALAAGQRRAARAEIAGLRDGVLGRTGPRWEAPA